MMSWTGSSNNMSVFDSVLTLFYCFTLDKSFKDMPAKEHVYHSRRRERES